MSASPKCVWLLIMTQLYYYLNASDVIYSYPECAPDCLTNNGGCPNNVNCHQVNGRVYKVDDKCYEAISGCYGCLNDPSSYPEHLKLIDCAGTIYLY